MIGTSPVAYGSSALQQPCRLSRAKPSMSTAGHLRESQLQPKASGFLARQKAAISCQIGGCHRVIPSAILNKMFRRKPQNGGVPLLTLETILKMRARENPRNGGPVVNPLITNQGEKGLTTTKKTAPSKLVNPPKKPLL